MPAGCGGGQGRPLVGSSFSGGGGGGGRGDAVAAALHERGRKRAAASDENMRALMKGEQTPARATAAANSLSPHPPCPYTHPVCGK